MESHSVTDDQYVIGPLNDVAFLNLKQSVPAQYCGPFQSELEFLQACAYQGSAPGSLRPSNAYDRGPSAKIFQLYNIVRPSYPLQNQSAQTFRFCHGDLNESNLLLDPTTGRITGVIDWEMSGFRPAWLAATTRTWFDDDQCRFIMTDDQDGPDGYDEETVDDAALRSHFLSTLKDHDPDLLLHDRHGTELRAMFHSFCDEFPANAAAWVEKYAKYGWDTNKRGPFPFNVQEWLIGQLDVWLELARDRDQNTKDAPQLL